MKDRFYFNWAWRQLLLVILIAGGLAYIVVLVLVSLEVVAADTVFRVASGGVRHISFPIVKTGRAYGAPLAIMIFAINFLISMVFVSLLFISPLLDPNAKEEFPSLIRRILIKPKFIDKYVFRFLGSVKAFRHLQNRSLIVLTMWLYLTPLVAVIFLGVELGMAAAGAQMLWRSFLLFAASVMPHGLLELPAVCLAAALPFGTYCFVRDAIRKGAVGDVFRDVRFVIRSRQTRRKLVYITCLLLSAGIVESRLTPLVAEWVVRMIR